MFVPLPLLIAIGVVVLILIAWVVRLAGRRDPLLGGQATIRRAPPLRPREEEIEAPVTTLPPEVATQVRALLSVGHKVAAIKLARDATHLGLQDAKDLVESME